MSIVLSIDGQSRQFDSESISIGRSADNTLAFPSDERLSPVHAVLKRVAGRWIIEAQSDRLIRIGDGRPTRFAWLNPGDTIHLAESGPSLQFKPGIADTPRSHVLGTAFARAERGLPSLARSSHTWPAVVVGGGAAAFLLIALGILLSGRIFQARHADDLAANGNNVSTIDAREASGDSALKQNAVFTDDSDAVYLVEMQAADGKQSVQLGTAWGINLRRLVTTGDIARGIELNRKHFPTAVARHSVSKRCVEITSFALHPHFEDAANRLEVAIRRIEELKAEYEDNDDRDVREKLIEQLRKSDDEAVLAAEEAVNVNVAILNVESDLAAVLRWSDGPVKDARIGQTLKLLGHPIPLAAAGFLVDPEHPVTHERRGGRLRSTARGHDSTVPERWLVGFDEPLKAENWSGSPVFDSRGIVVGIYVRPTPQLPGAGSATVVTHDVAVTECLKVLMSHTPPAR